MHENNILKQLEKILLVRTRWTIFRVHFIGNMHSHSSKMEIAFSDGSRFALWEPCQCNVSIKMKLYPAYLKLWAKIKFSKNHKNKHNRTNMNLHKKETIILLPISFIFTLIIFWFRLYLKGKVIPKLIDIENRSQFLIVWTTVI